METAHRILQLSLWRRRHLFVFVMPRSIPVKHFYSPRMLFLVCLRDRWKLIMLKHSIIPPFILSALAYLGFFYVRTQQAWNRFGELVDLYPVSRRLRLFFPSLDLTVDQWRWTSYLLLLMIAGCYLWVLWQLNNCTSSPSNVGRGRHYFQSIVLPYCLFGLISLFAYPHVSRPMDTVDYAVHARIWTAHRDNPYVVSGFEYVKDEPLVRFMEVKRGPTLYGPFWQYVSLLPAFFGQGDLLASILAYKALFFLLGGLCLWLIWAFHIHVGGTGLSAVLVGGAIVAWNPLMHLVSHGGGHNDIVMATFAAGIVVALVLRRTTWSFVSWSLASTVKFITAPLLIPSLALLLRRGATQDKTHSRFMPTLYGLFTSAVVTILVIMPFGLWNVLGSVSGRYGGLIDSEGTSKISILVTLLSRITQAIGLAMEPDQLNFFVGLALPASWLLYTLVRGLGVRDVQSFVKVAIESFLFYVTFVSLPVHAQYMVTPLILAGFVYTGAWHRLAVVIASLALVWDSLLLVYLPSNYPSWERYGHQLSHLTVIIVVAAYLSIRAFRSFVVRR